MLVWKPESISSHDRITQKGILKSKIFSDLYHFLSFHSIKKAKVETSNTLLHPGFILHFMSMYCWFISLVHSPIVSFTIHTLNVSCLSLTELVSGITLRSWRRTRKSWCLMLTFQHKQEEIRLRKEACWAGHKSMQKERPNAKNVGNYSEEFL